MASTNIGHIFLFNLQQIEKETNKFTMPTTQIFQKLLVTNLTKHHEFEDDYPIKKKKSLQFVFHSICNIIFTLQK